MNIGKSLSTLGAAAVATTMIVAGSPPTPASAVENTECSISVSAVVRDETGGNKTILNCRNAKHVSLWMEAKVIVGGLPQYKRLYPNPTSWPSLTTSSRTFNVTIALAGVSSLEVESKVCYDWAGAKKCRIRSDYVTLAW